jgi:hypothetical protein
VLAQTNAANLGECIGARAGVVGLSIWRSKHARLTDWDAALTADLPCSQLKRRAKHEGVGDVKQQRCCGEAALLCLQVRKEGSKLGAKEDFAKQRSIPLYGVFQHGHQCICGAELKQSAASYGDP